MFKKTPLASAISSIAVASAIGAAGASLPQSANAAEDLMEEVVVTGSRIRDANLVSASPITTIDAEEFDLAGATRVEDLLNTFPQISPSFDSFTVNPTTGFATADLYGLGINRTLVLVNGHRMQPGGIRSEARDLNQIPAALIKRVEVLTGGASAVYGSDAVSGVINFILDTDFEGVSLSFGRAGYQHDNDNSGMQRLMTDKGFDFPDGDSGLDGESDYIDVALGTGFGEGQGHAMAYFTWRENDALRQSARDYSSCALSGDGLGCGGSSTAPNPNFFVFHRPSDPANSDLIGFAHMESDGSWAPGVGEEYNYAPPNHFQRPDERWTMGSAISYQISPQFEPYMETMVANTNTSVQIAESGTFFVNTLTFDANEPLIGSLYSDLGLDPTADSRIYVGKRNVEGGPRISKLESTSFRTVVGMRGDINQDWSYDASYTYGRTTSNEASINDFLIERLGDALLQCREDSAPDSCIPYNVWTPGGVTETAANALSGTGLRKGVTEIETLGAYVTGMLPFTLPTASSPVSLVAGLEVREDTYDVDVDVNMEQGNFAGMGGPRLPVGGSFKAEEIYFEAGVPILEGAGLIRTLNADLGFRRSDYDTSGDVDTWKIGVVADVGDYVRLRGGFNRAIRAANVNELFSTQQIALWSGEDPCAGATPEFTQAQCANTGVSATQYGNIPESPADQYNQFIGGNENLNPEEADTVTFGFVVTPLDNLTASIDYYQIEIEERIGTIGASTTLRFCGLTGDPSLCTKVNRNATSGDLWLGSDPNVAGHVENVNANFGELSWRGINLNATYNQPIFRGTLSASINGTHRLEAEVAPLPGVNPAATYDCAGVINTSCDPMPEWRHTARVSYAQDWWMASLRWRYIGEVDYENTDGTPGTTDKRLGSGLDAENYFDLTASLDPWDNINFTLGVNNIFDEEPPLVGGTLQLNANTVGGYDQIGRYMHLTFNLRY